MKKKRKSLIFFTAVSLAFLAPFLGAAPTSFEYQIFPDLKIVNGYPSTLTVMDVRNIFITDSGGDSARLKGATLKYRLGLADRWGGSIVKKFEFQMVLLDTTLDSKDADIGRYFVGEKSGIPFRIRINGKMIAKTFDAGFSYAVNQKYGRIYYDVPGEYFGVSFPISGWIDLTEVAAKEVPASQKSSFPPDRPKK